MNFIFGALFGVLLTVLSVYTYMTVGTLKVYIPDQQDEQPYLYVELEKPLDQVCKKKAVVFLINVKDLDSQK